MFSLIFFNFQTIPSLPELGAGRVLSLLLAKGRMKIPSITMSLILTMMKFQPRVNFYEGGLLSRSCMIQIPV